MIILAKSFFGRVLKTVKTRSTYVKLAFKTASSKVESSLLRETHIAKKYEILFYEDGIYKFPMFLKYDFALIVSKKTFIFKIYNNSNITAKLDNINTLNWDNISFSGIKQNDVILPYETKKIVVQTTNIGTMSLNAFLSLNFSDKKRVSYNFLGKRGVIFDFLPNGEYSETKKFSTDIFTSLDATEKRVLRSKDYKHCISFNIISNPIRAKELLSYGLKQSLLVPLWFSVNLSQKNYIGIKSIALNTKIFEFKHYLCVISKDGNANFRAIISKTDNNIVLDTPININKNDIIVPLINATTKNSINYAITNSNHASYTFYTLEFEEI